MLRSNTKRILPSAALMTDHPTETGVDLVELHLRFLRFLRSRVTYHHRNYFLPTFTTLVAKVSSRLRNRSTAVCAPPVHFYKVNELAAGPRYFFTDAILTYRDEPIFISFNCSLSSSRYTDEW